MSKISALLIMEIEKKQKRKKRRTRRNLNEIRKRSHNEVKNNVNPKNYSLLKLHKSKCSNNEQITSKRLTLTLLNKTIRSETVTRYPSSRVDHKINIDFNNSHRGKENHNIFSISSKQSQHTNTASSFMAGEKKKTTKDQIENSKIVDVVANNTADSATLFSPLDKLYGVSVFEISSEEYMQESLTHTARSRSQVESEDCLYKKFMNALPKYLTEKFPLLAKESVNKNIAYLKQTYLDHCHQETRNIAFKSINNNFPLNIPKDYRDSALQQRSWQQSVKKKASFIISSGSSSLSQFGNNSNNSKTFLHDSPEYLYFPHKLNQLS